MRYLNHAAIAHPTEARILLVPTPDGVWALPSVRSEGDEESAVAELRARIEREVGIPVVFLRTLHMNTDFRQRGEFEQLCLLEGQEIGSARIGAGRWVGRDEIADVALATPDYRPHLQQWLREDGSRRIPTLRPGWARRGWHAEATRWGDARLADAGIERSGPVDQVRVWSLSCILKFPTGHGPVFFKAVPPFFRQEGKTTAMLARDFPDLMPDVVAVHPRKGWMLMRPLRGKELYECGADTWPGGVRALAAMQISYAGRADELLSAGIRDRRLRTLRASIAPTLADNAVVGGLESDEVSALRSYSPRLEAMCDDLEALGIPDSLMHGDFHPGNVMENDGTYTIFDWTDACVSHPFLDMPVFAASKRKDDPPDIVDRLWKAYLDIWFDNPPASLWRIRYLADTLGAVHHAISYHELDLQTEKSARWEMWGMREMWLRRLLRRLQTEPAQG